MIVVKVKGWQVGHLLPENNIDDGNENVDPVRDTLDPLDGVIGGLNELLSWWTDSDLHESLPLLVELLLLLLLPFGVPLVLLVLLLLPLLLLLWLELEPFVFKWFDEIFCIQSVRGKLVAQDIIEGTWVNLSNSMSNFLLLCSLRWTWVKLWVWKFIIDADCC